MLSRLVFCLVMGGACPFFLPVARADDQADRIRALEERLERSLQLIEKLSARVSELENGARTAPDKPDSSRAADVSRLQESVNQVSASLANRNFDTGLPLHGFADVGAGWSTREDPVRLRGFSVGTLDLYLTPQVSDRVRALAEVAFEFDRKGDGSADMERLQLGYTASDELTLWAGRFHTPFGLWNTSFHHGANLQTSIYRPRFIEFEDNGGIIPAHSVGLWASGRSKLGVGRMTYDLYVSNGPSIRERQLDPNTLIDDTHNKLVGINAGYMPRGASGGLTIGVHAFGSTVNSSSPSADVFNKTRLRVGGAYAGYDADDWEMIAEYYLFRNVDVLTDNSLRSHAGFIHIGRTLGSWTPFARYERASLNPQDGYFLSQLLGRTYWRAVLGARFLLDPRSSLKFELSATREGALRQLDEFGAIIPFASAGYRRAAFQYSLAF